VSLPQWILLISILLASAVLLGVIAQRVRLQLTVVLAVVGFVAGWLLEPLGVEIPLRGEEFEEILLFLFLPVLVFDAALGLSTRASSVTWCRSSCWPSPRWSSRPCSSVSR
jgi:monovalent cation:H+ antiporter, CPA1 family